MPVVVRAQQPGSVIIEFATVEGFVVAAPYWRFENLTVRGVCGDDSQCEHAFHVVANGAHFAAVNNTVLDFNAHFKINGDKGAFPDDGLIEGNTLANTHARKTAHPVTPIDLVAASGWTIRANLISDFIKAGGDRISYGAFAKGAGERNLFERNVVWCEQRLRGLLGQRVGLSLGGGGTGKPYCRDRQCISEQQQGVVRDNLIASCSDAGIYLNSASASRVEHNTVLDTAGIDVRFPTSSAELEGNLVDGAIRARNDAVLHLGDNRSTAPAWSYLGRHPVRALFRDPDSGDLGWRDGAPRAARPAARPDLCGRARAASPAYGAFEDYAACLRPAAAGATSSSKSAS
jgi:parallel beta-helix repeat protein